MDSGFNLHRCIELRLIWVRMINVALKGILLKQSGNDIRGVWETGPWESEDEFSKPINMGCFQKAWCWILLVSLAMNKQVFVVVLFCFYYFLVLFFISCHAFQKLQCQQGIQSLYSCRDYLIHTWEK